MTSTPPPPQQLDIAAIVPCYNEEATVAKVVSDLRRTFDGITVYVYDNNSKDATRERAREAGAIVRTETLQGKGNVVRRAFADVDADVYLLIDGDDTYDVASAPAMVEALLEGPYDHVLGCRVDDPDNSAYRKGHAWGNRFFNRVVSRLFGEPVTDMLSGFRVFSRRFVKSFPALSQRFEIETELTVHSLATRVPQIEKPVGFGERPDGSESKLSTFSDGRRIILTIAKLFAFEKPFVFWGAASIVAFLAGLISGIPVISEYARTGLVERFPTAFLAAIFMVIACLMVTAGVILTGTTRNRHEAARLAYLGLAPVTTPGLAPQRELSPEELRAPQHERAPEPIVPESAPVVRGDTDRLQRREGQSLGGR
ncbi:glycosyltransferase [Brachybacterium kimchii]|uniref:Glycosyltransferase n=1 Tax=Brachybacterium kimchii TaxID=2942909 RepID=A0ABY4ND97_9MICO|nr:glycosyltransferase [Brachybacterium kimchii]UQN31583.1 glycosyltransferase [Brachybacterium kimchii]